MIRPMMYVTPAARAPTVNWRSAPLATPRPESLPTNPPTISMATAERTMAAMSGMVLPKVSGHTTASR